MNKIRNLSLILLIYSCTTLIAQVRESVVIVRPSLSDDGVAVYHSISEYFRNRNHDELADYFESLTKGGFGSGFLTTDRYGRSVIITNRHVVTFAGSATVTFSNEEGQDIPIEGCPVVYEDANIDCALILLPKGVLEGAPRLKLADSVPVDGETVWSAGYPALFGKPSWQLGKGVVTNRRVVVDRLGLPDYAVFTQHSAPIDPGNSGGPLLVGDPTDPSSFRVVGVNAWMILGRQSTNFAVSLDKLREALDRIPDPGNPYEPIGAIRAKAEKLVDGLNAKEWSRFESSHYISSRMVMLQGWDVFTSTVSAEKEADSKVWVARFLGESPEETLRQAIYFRIYQALHEDGRAVALDSVEELPEVAGARRVRTGLKVNKNTFYLDWNEESGNWRILEAGIPSASLRGPEMRVEAPAISTEKSVEAPAISTEKPVEIPVTSWVQMPPSGYPFPSGLTIGVGLTSVPTIYGWQTRFNLEIGYHLGIGRIASFGAALVFDQGASLVENPSQLQLMSQSVLMIFSLAGEARLGFPIQLGSMNLFPFIGGGLRAGLSPTDDGSITFRISVEADTGLLLRPSSGWSIGVSLGPSFATDNGLRLEGIPVKLFLLF